LKLAMQSFAKPGAVTVYYTISDGSQMLLQNQSGASGSWR